jgi:type I restriction enzyme S subunit
VKAGWQVKRLGEVIEKLETVDPLKLPGTKFDYVDVSSVSNLSFQIEQTTKITSENAPSRARRKIRTNDVIFATIRPTLQRIAFVPPELDQQICSTGYMVLRAKAAVLPKYIFHFLFSDEFSVAMESLQKGASYPAVTDGEVRDQSIPIPPLEEQKRIVAILDEVFEGLTRARAHTETNLQNARDLFLRSVEAEFEALGETNSRQTVGEIAVIKGGKRLPKGENTVLTKTPHPYISIKNFNEYGSVDLDGIEYLRPETYQAIKNYIIRSEDLYISIAGTIGKTGIVPDELDGANLTENAARMVFREGFNNQYVYYFSLTADFQDQAGLNTRTAAQPKLALERLKTISIPVVTIDKQLALVRKFQTIREQSKNAQSSYRAKLADLDALRQSLLQKAFAGELT